MSSGPRPSPAAADPISAHDGLEALHTLILPALSPIPPQGGAPARLFASLQQRVAASAIRNRAYATCRARDGGWQEAAPGVRSKALPAGPDWRITLLQMAPGSRWMHHEARRQEAPRDEVLVLEGALRCDVHAVPAQGFLTVPAGPVALKADARLGALVYLREDLGGIPTSAGATEPEGAWRELPGGVHGRLLAWRWRETHLEASVLLRCPPGSVIPEHPHGLDEDALMLSGDGFIGDLLIGPGDYQFAPAGSAHADLQTDAGCLLFVHGALNPVRWPVG